jgi:cobalt-zinc-cadmium efflux system protein
MVDPSDHGHDHRGELRALSQRRLWWALSINAVFLLVELVGGILTHSLALLADSGHMFTDVAALGLALFVAHLAKRPATAERTFGLLRAEVLGAFINGAILMLIVGLIFWESFRRFGHPETIDGPAMLFVAILGLMANLASAMILAKGREENVNMQGAFLHMVADALGSVGAILAGLVIWLSGWYPVDSIASIVIGLLILWSSWDFIKRTVNILLEATPEHIDYEEVKDALESLEHVDRVHDLHIWTITSGMPVISAHMRLASCCCDINHWQDCLGEAQRLLEDRFGITHTTLQIESSQESSEAACHFFDKSDPTGSSSPSNRK